MSALFDSIKSDFAAKAGRQIEVPEWKATLFYDPLTAKERRLINLGVADGDEAGMMINLLIHKMKDEKGAPVFPDDATTRSMLTTETDFQVITRIVTSMGVQAESAAEVDAAKNA